MKKIMLILSLAVISYFNAFAQMTPEAAMAACPNLPTEAQMIAYLDGKGDPDLYKNFKEALNNAQTRLLQLPPCSCNPHPDIARRDGSAFPRRTFPS